MFVLSFPGLCNHSLSLLYSCIRSPFRPINRPASVQIKYVLYNYIHLILSSSRRSRVRHLTSANHHLNLCEFLDKSGHYSSAVCLLIATLLSFFIIIIRYILIRIGAKLFSKRRGDDHLLNGSGAHTE